ncbi:uncharacterized protein BCR38DRAFT_357264, partial [Pseudomassariella vexata]
AQTTSQSTSLKMYNSYGSYSSMSELAQPMNITQGTYLSSPSHGAGSCAFPSWPQRSSLAESARDERATSYLSDDDLFPQDLEDDAHSISSASSATSGSLHMTSEELLEIQREKAHMQREALRFLLIEKERRKLAYKKQRRSSSGSSSKKETPRSKPSAMTPISEAVE